MNKTMKKVSTISAAVLAVAVMATAAFAADYATVPAGVTSPSNTVVASTASESISSAVEAAASGTSTAELKTLSNVVLSADVVKALADGNGVLEIVTPKATLSIDASTVKKVAKLNLSATVNNTKTSTVVDFKSTKKFNCEVKVTVTSCKMSADDLAKAHVYYNGENLGSVEIDENGNPVFTVTKGGKYEIK